MIWLHFLALAAATFAYAKCLEISRAGSWLAAVSFTLCGFQAVHVGHEPFYHTMPGFRFLSACYCDVTTGRLAWLAGLVLAWGTQLTLGHFHFMWTGGLVLVIGSWRAFTNSGGQLRVPGRVIGLLVGLCWGAAIAWVQLQLTWELSGVAGFTRPAELLMNYVFPPAQCAQFALPQIFLVLLWCAGDAYWHQLQTSPGEVLRLCWSRAARPCLRLESPHRVLLRDSPLATDRTAVVSPGDDAGYGGQTAISCSSNCRVSVGFVRLLAIPC